MRSMPCGLYIALDTSNGFGFAGTGRLNLRGKWSRFIGVAEKYLAIAIEQRK